jgi:molybdopterin-guanine dinucleotide biosynthesis protein A
VTPVAAVPKADRPPEDESGRPVAGTGGTDDAPDARDEALDEARYDAVILAGGRARRMGGADKPGLPVAGRPLIAWVADAVADAGRVVVVGPDRPDLPGTVTVREDPPGSGPVPALRAGLAEVRAAWVTVLAADLPFLRAGHVRALLAQARAHGRGAVLVDDDGREQWLAGAWSGETLRSALAGHHGASLEGLLGPLRPALVGSAEPRPPWYDCDTPEDLAAAAGM